MVYYPRNIEKVILDATKSFRSVVLSGARQTGKSTLLKKLLQPKYEYISFDNPRYLKFAKEDPEAFLEEYKFPLLIDEIQYVPEIMPFIKLKIDQHQKKGMYVLTGSQQFTLMKGLQETLAGRVAIFQLFPFAVTEGKGNSRNFIFRATQGSFPEIINLPKDKLETWYSSYISTYIEKDVSSIYHLEKITHFKDLLFLLAHRVSQVLNYNSLASDLGVSISAIKLWISILETSQLLYLLKPYYTNLGSRIIKSPKVYFTDLGLLNYLLGMMDKNTLLKSSYAGAIFENYVIQEVIKHYSNIGRVAPIYYYRTNNGLEVDLIIEERLGLLRPCEIKLTRNPNPGTLNQITRLINLNKKKNITFHKLSIITRTEKSYPISKDAKVYELKDFLSGLSSLSKN